jgi:hypothetical protein
MTSGHDEVALDERKSTVRGPQRIVGVIVGLVIVIGGYGCRYALREASNDAADRVTQDAIEDAYRYQPPTTRPRPTTEPVADSAPESTAPATTTTPAPTTTAPAADALPEGWPAGLTLVDGFTVQSTSDVGGLAVIGNVKGDLVAVTETIRADLTEAGFVIDDLGSTAPAAGGSVTQAAGPAGTATVLISPVPDTPGALLVTYRLQPVG